MEEIAQREVGTIFLKIEGVSKMEIERYHSIITTMLQQGALNVRNGEVTLSFDNMAQLSTIKLNYTKYNRRYDIDDKHK